MAAAGKQLPKLTGRATTEGQQYEVKLAALLNVRARRRGAATAPQGLRYELATNVAEAEPCNDVVFRLRWREGAGKERCLTYLIQLKHARDAKALNEGSFSGDKGDFSIKKYFAVYKRLKEQEVVHAERMYTKEEEKDREEEKKEALAERQGGESDKKNQTKEHVTDTGQTAAGGTVQGIGEDSEKETDSGEGGKPKTNSTGGRHEKKHKRENEYESRNEVRKGEELNHRKEKEGHSKHNTERHTGQRNKIGKETSPGETDKRKVSDYNETECRNKQKKENERGRENASQINQNSESIEGLRHEAINVHPHGKQYLTIHPATDYRFIIYTTKTFKTARTKSTRPNPKKATQLVAKETNQSTPKPATPPTIKQLEEPTSNLPNTPDFPFCELLSSNEGDLGFMLSEKHKEVWNLWNGHDDEYMYKYEFLPRVRVFSSQKNSGELDDVIREELKDHFHLNQETTSRILTDYLSEASKWWERDVGDLWTDETTELEDIVKEQINSAFEGNKNPIHFSPSSCTVIEDAIARHRITVVLVPGVAQHWKCLKVLQVMESKFSRLKIVKLQQKVLRLIEQAICAISKVYYDETAVLVSVEYPENDILNMIQKLLQETHCKIILVATEVHEAFRSFKQITDFVEVEDIWNFAQLSPNSQATLLKSSMRFQGHKIMLETLKTVWPSLEEDVDGALLCALLDGTATLSGETSKRSEDSGNTYIYRAVEHRTILKPEILDLHVESDKLVLGGFPRHETDRLEMKYKQKTSGSSSSSSSSSSSNNNEKSNGNSVTMHLQKPLEEGPWVILSYEEDRRSEEREREEFEKLCSNYDQTKNIHYISYKNGSIVWMATHGSNTQIVPYLMKSSDECISSSPCTHYQKETNFTLWKDKILFLSGDAGMGKTMFITQLMKEHRSPQWNVFIALSQYAKLLHLMPRLKDVEERHLVDLLVEAVTAENSSSPPSTRKFLKCLLNSGFMTVFLDGMDEVCPTHKEKVIQLIKRFAATPVSKVWVTFRPHLVNDLQAVFSCEPLLLLPFSKGEQLDYIFSIISNANHQETETALKQKISVVLEDLDKTAKDRGHSIWDVPLHAYIFAKTYLEKPDILKVSEDTDTFTLLKLYQGFVKYNALNFEKKYGFDGTSTGSRIFESFYVEMHENCAMMTLEELKGIVSEKHLKRYLKQNLGLLKDDNTGIVTFIEGFPHFSHHVFAEYFGASFLRDNFEEEMTESLWEKMTPMMRYFFDAMLADGFALHEAAIAGDARCVQSIIAKLGEEREEALEKIDRGGRSALHLAAIHANADVCHILMDAGSDIRVKDGVFCWRPLRYADASGHLSTIDAILDGGGVAEDVEKTLKNNTLDGSIFRTAAREGYENIVRVFLDAGMGWRGTEEERRKCSNEGGGNTSGMKPLH